MVPCCISTKLIFFRINYPAKDVHLRNIVLAKGLHVRNIVPAKGLYLRNVVPAKCVDA